MDLCHSVTFTWKIKRNFSWFNSVCSFSNNWNCFHFIAADRRWNKLHEKIFLNLERKLLPWIHIWPQVLCIVIKHFPCLLSFFRLVPLNQIIFSKSHPKKNYHLSLVGFLNKYLFSLVWKKQISTEINRVIN
jgi:hypothetical protein